MRQKGDTHTIAQPTQLRTAWTDRRLSSGTFSWLVHSNDQVHVSDRLIFSWLKRLLIITTHALRQISQKSYWTVQALSARHTTPLPTAESWRQPFSDCNHIFLELTVHCVIWICIVKKNKLYVWFLNFVFRVSFEVDQKMRSERIMTQLLPLYLLYVSLCLWEWTVGQLKSNFISAH